MRQRYSSEMFLKTRTSQVGYYRKVPLYICRNGKYVLYKKKGRKLPEVKIADGTIPSQFFIRLGDKLLALEETQKGLNLELRKAVSEKNPEKIKAIIVTLMTETLQFPTWFVFEGLLETMDIVVGDFVKDSSVVEKLLNVVNKDYTTMIHSINVMAFALIYAKYMDWSLERTKDLGLCALLHDIGKVEIPDKILKADQKLTQKEFEQIMEHPIAGYNMLGNTDFGIRSKVKRVALEHHEKLDGSGYPYRIKDMCEESRIIAIIDCYEALTNDDRPYRRAMSPLHALRIIKVDAADGKYDEKIFKNFVYSLI